MNLTEELSKNLSDIAETMQILCYQNYPSFFLENYNTDINLYLEPLLFTLLNYNNFFDEKDFKQISRGYISNTSTDGIVCSRYNSNNVAYLPKIGYLKKKANQILPLLKVENSLIEVLKVSTPFLKPVFQTSSGESISNKNIQISESLVEKFLPLLNRAFYFLRHSVPEHTKLIEKVCKMFVIYKTDPVNTNSFATINAHGIAFINVYQDHYNEVFFVDDIAHQTGHIIMTTALFKRKDIFKINENINIGNFTNNKKEYRNLYVLFHALYTYNSTLLCLEACIDNNFFKDDLYTEAIARICFYLRKFSLDMNNLGLIINCHNSVNNVLTKKGQIILKEIAKQFQVSLKRWESTGLTLDFSNQTYNFNFKLFVEANPEFYG